MARPAGERSIWNRPGWEPPKLGRPELLEREARPAEVELFVVLARAERPLSLVTMEKRLKERGHDLGMAAIEAALSILAEKKIAEPTEKFGQFQLNLDLREKFKGRYPD